jgi:phospholipase C
MNGTYRGAALLALAFVTGCGEGSTLGAPSSHQLSLRPDSGSNPQAIKHIVLVIQENRTFDNFFATFPGADGATQGLMKLPSGGHIAVPLQPKNLVERCDFGHGYKGYLKDYDGGAMDGFNTEGGGKLCPGASGAETYQYVIPQQIAPYWTIAQQYVLADHMFTTQGSGSFTNHQDLIAGGTFLGKAQTKSLVDFPSGKPWGCDAAAGTVTSFLQATPSRLRYRYRKGPFPCMSYETLRDLLDAKGVSWMYYSPPSPGGTGAIWNAFDAIKAVREGPEWRTNVARPQNFFFDVTNQRLPAMSWVVPDRFDSDHPGTTSDTGPSWVASIVNAVGGSPYWKSTVVIVVWDDWGGFYDHEPPPFQDQWGGLGFRVPMLVVAPYAVRGGGSQGGYISKTQYEFGSILKFIETVFDLGSLGTTDVRATSILNCFDFTQPPRVFTKIPSQYSRSYFLHRPPSNLPVDTE